MSVQASWQVAHRGSYGRLPLLQSWWLGPRPKPWEPDRQPNQTPEDAIYHLSRTLYREGKQNPRIPAAYTFLGQFITHDITFDTRFDPLSGTRRRANQRTPALDLDSVYGRGAIDQPYLYELDNPDRFTLGCSSAGEFDLPRNADASVSNPSNSTPESIRHSALISDPRNDENIIISQLHLAFLRFHNVLVERGASFLEARRSTAWHYQWVVLNDYLPLVCGKDAVERAKKRRIFALRPRPLLPDEFILAAFRFGHSMVGKDYHLNDAIGSSFLIFSGGGVDWNSRDGDAVNNLEGERSLPPRWTVQWDRFLNLDTGTLQPSQQIDACLAFPLERLPLRVPNWRLRSLAYLTLLRGYEAGLPSGQRLAARLGVEIPAALADSSDPLWLYVLREAALGTDEQRGNRLGELGALIVAEVMIRLLEEDEHSIVHQRQWRPNPGRRGNGHFDLADFLIQSGAPITAADWKDQVSRRRGP